MSVVLFALASMASVADKPVKDTYQVSRPMAEVRDCILLYSDREARLIERDKSVMIGFSYLARFFAVVTLLPSKDGTTVEVRGNGLTAQESTCVKPTPA